MIPEHEMEQTNINFRCSEALADHIRRASFKLDRSASELIRSCIILAIPQVLALRGLDRVDVEDIRFEQDVSKNNAKQG